MEAKLGINRTGMSLGEKLGQVTWGLVLLLVLTACVGFAMMYSAANGSYDPWAWRQMVRFSVGVAMMLAIALVDVRLWLQSAYVIYAVALVLLVLVEIMGITGSGAQRWVDLWLFQLQPSEVMKIALVMALARYFHGLTLDEARRPSALLVPLFLMLAPAALVLRQPDLGTALLLLISGTALLFVAGVRVWVFASTIAAGLAAIPVGWQFLHDYQKQRIFTFINPERDPLGAGYHILQSKIALGSGGVGGKGFLAGSQSHLNFLPEKQTDFVFTMLAEEFGLVGGLVLIGLYALILIYGIAISMRSTSHFGRLLGMGLTTTFFVYVFINIAMVTGLVPVVGVPLPLVSYGGTSMMTILIGFGLIMGVYVHRDVAIPRLGGGPV
ncbi:MAG: rod shape-determining protein RodA [Alphaproteobacteria bacterium]